MRGKERIDRKNITFSCRPKTSPKGLVSFKFNEEGLQERIDAETGTWENGVWKLKNIIVYDLVTGKVSPMSEMAYTAIESPKIFSEDSIKVEEMTLTELIRYKNRLAEAGFRNVKAFQSTSVRAFHTPSSTSSCFSSEYHYPSAENKKASKKSS